MPTQQKAASFLTDYDLHLFSEGTHGRVYEKLGAHLTEREGVRGAHFAVWAPNAEAVHLVGEFNGWRAGRHALRPNGATGIWSGFVPHLESGELYKYEIHSRLKGYRVQKADPFAFASESRPRTASRIWDLGRYAWGDEKWMAAQRPAANRLESPVSIYEVHLGSWRRVPEDGNRWLTYREMGPQLAAYASEMGFTHVEFLPVSEHPFDGSWGYQPTAYFAPTSRFGTPDDFRFLVDTLHQHGVGVILDWVPGHFPTDEHGLHFFDGTHLYEHADPRRGFHPEWNTAVFNYSRREVSNFLLSNALFWFDRYHVDGLRVDAVASMLYLDYSRKAGEWVPNEYGGRENIDAIHFLRRLNEAVYKEYPHAMMIAEESTAWPMVSRPTYVGGLGFGLKWDMGWMNDTLAYLSHEPVHRKFHHNTITFRMIYAFTENFALPLSHDEVVYGKGSLIARMPGDAWQKCANLRLLYGYQFTQPGKKLLFMGGEFGQWSEWSHDASLDWHLLERPAHQGIRRWVRDLNTFYRGERALHERDVEAEGFRWVDCSDYEQSVLVYLRFGLEGADPVLVACNFTPVVRQNYRVGIPSPGRWAEILNSDAPLYGGSGQGNFGGLDTVPIAWHGYPQSVNLLLPPLAVVVFKPAL